MARSHATVVDARDISPTVRHLSLRSDAPLRYRAGQWLNLHVPVDGGLERRAYSIANAPDPLDPGRFELAVTAVPGGRVSGLLHGLGKGERVVHDAPEGFFTREGHEADALLLVGTGTGLAPLRAIMQEVLAEPEGPPMTLLFGCRSRADILFHDELRAAVGSGRLSLHVTLSRPEADWEGRTGYVQTHLGEVLGAERPRVFVCGLSPMIKAVRQALKSELGYDRHGIHSERYD